MAAATATPRTTRAKNVTYLGRRARVWDTIKGSKNTAERVAFVLWVDPACEKNGSHPAGTVTAHHCKGDGRYADFQSFARGTFTSVEDAQAWAARRLGA